MRGRRDSPGETELTVKLPGKKESMVQDVYPHKFDNTYKNDVPEDDSLLVICAHQKIMCRIDETNVALPTVAEAEKLWGLKRENFRYILAVDDVSCFLCMEEVPEKEGYIFEHLLIIRGHDPQYLSFAAVVGAHLAHWYSSNRFCGKCGKPLVHKEDQRAMICGECGNMAFPRINPIVIAAVTDGDKMLVARYNKKHLNTRNNQYVLLAGYVEIGESYEDTVRREIREETGLEIRNVRYVASQPWPFSQTAIAGFYAEADSTLPLKRQKEELSELLWVKKEELPPRKNRTSITDNLIEWFRAGMSLEEIQKEREELAEKVKENII